MEKEDQQQLMFKLAMFEQKMQGLQQQLQAVEEALVDLGLLSSGLDEIKGAKGKEIMAPLGRGIFVKANLASEELLVDIGGKKLVTKSIPDTKYLISEQLSKLEKIKEDLTDSLEASEDELRTLMSEAREEQELED